MPDEVIERVHEIATRQKCPEGIEFLRQDGTEFMDIDGNTENNDDDTQLPPVEPDGANNDNVNNAEVDHPAGNEPAVTDDDTNAPIADEIAGVGDEHGDFPGVPDRLPDEAIPGVDHGPIEGENADVIGDEHEHIDVPEEEQINIPSSYSFIQLTFNN